MGPAGEPGEKHKPSDTAADDILKFEFCAKTGYSMIANDCLELSGQVYVVEGAQSRRFPELVNAAGEGSGQGGDQGPFVRRQNGIDVAIAEDVS